MTSKKTGDAFLDAIQEAGKKDNVALVLVDYKKDASLIVQRNNLGVCLRALLYRYIDDMHQRLDCEPEQAVKRTERVLKGWLNEWGNEYE